MSLLDTGRAIWDGCMDLTGLAVWGDRLVYAADETETTLAVPGYRQTQTYTCGFAAGLMVLHTFKPRASIDRFFYRVSPDPEMGIDTAPLAAALRRSGIGVRLRKDLTFDSIAAAIEDGYPIVTTIRTADDDVDHWVVVYGYGVSPSRVFVAGNGFFASKVMPWGRFRARWRPKGLGLVCWGVER